jgi:hypothetical protein
VIGWSTTMSGANERFIDIHQAARSSVQPLIEKRIELAKTIGCDAIVTKDNDLPAYQDAGQLGHGFTFISLGEYESWTDVVTSHAHELTLSVGQRNGTTLRLDHVALTHDWLMVDRCGEQQSCDQLKPYLNKQKAVFAIEYDKAEDGTANGLTAVCGELESAGIKSGIIKTIELSNTPYMHCM